MSPKQCLVSVILCALGSLYADVYAYEEDAFNIQCGISHIPIKEGNDPDERESHLIVGGQEVRRGSWPFMAYLQYKRKYVVCGGAILNENWILTAAHCVKNVTHEPETISIVVGAHIIYVKDQQIPEKIRRTPNYIVMYPGYIEEPTQYDLALIHLDRPLDFTQSTNGAPVCLPRPGEELPPGTNVYILGWGRKSEQDLYSPHLRQVMMPVISYDQCVQVQESQYVNPPDEKTFCVMYEQGGHNACNGDSGGPVLAFNGESWVVYGIVSRGPEICASAWGPTVNTKVSDYVGWIDSVISKSRRK